MASTIIAVNSDHGEPTVAPFSESAIMNIIDKVVKLHCPSNNSGKERKRMNMSDSLQAAGIGYNQWYTWMNIPKYKDRFRRYKEMLNDYQIMESEALLLEAVSGHMRITDIDQVRVAEKILKNKTLESNIGLTHKIEEDRRTLLTTGEIMFRLAELINKAKERNVISLL